MSANWDAAEGSFASRVSSLSERIEVRAAGDEAARDEIFRLRYHAYRKEGAIAARPDKRFEDAFDHTPNVRIFGLYLEGMLASSVRVHVASRDFPQSPALAVFADILRPVIDRNGIVVDPTRLVSDPSLSADMPGLSYLTVRLGFVASQYFDADLGLATVREEHRAFYRRTFRLDELSEPRMYPGLRKPIVMMGKSFAASRDETLARYPFMNSTAEERERLFGGMPVARRRADVAESAAA